MTQEVLPQIRTATQAVEQLIAATETEIAQMKEAIAEKKRLVKGWKKGIHAFSARPKNQKSSLASA